MFGPGKEQPGIVVDKGQFLNLKGEMLLLPCSRSTCEKRPAVYKGAHFTLVWCFSTFKPFHIHYLI